MKKIKSNTKQNFLQGSLWLTSSALLAKICGALFKLPLTNLLGGTGMGYFSCAYGLFLPLYAIFVTGLSTAVARPTAYFAGRQQFACALKVRQTARKLCLAMGLAGTGIAAAAAKYFTKQTTGDMLAYPAVLAMTPAIVFCCLTAVERGYQEGLCHMTPTALSQAAEAVIKLIFGLYFCHLFLQIPTSYTPESMGALGAVLGVTLSTMSGWVCMLIGNIKLQSETDTSTENIPSSKQTLQLLIKIMIPAALGALVTNLTSLIDLMTVMHCFQNMLHENIADFYQKVNLSKEVPADEAAAFVYGSFMGLSVAVFNLVPSLTNMLAKSVLPCTAQAWAAGRHKKAAEYARQVLVLTGLAAIPAGCGMFAMSDGILEFLFSGRDAEIQAAVAGLQWLSPALLCLCLSFPVFSLLQAVGREDLPVKIMLPGIVIKLVCNLLLIPRCGTVGAAISTSICYGFIFAFAFYFLLKMFQQPLHIAKPLLCQAWGGILCAAAARVSYDRLVYHMPQRAAFCIAVLCAVLIYIFVLFLTSGNEIKTLSVQNVRPWHTDVFTKKAFFKS